MCVIFLILFYVSFYLYLFYLYLLVRSFVPCLSLCSDGNCQIIQMSSATNDEDIRNIREAVRAGHRPQRKYPTQSTPR